MERRNNYLIQAAQAKALFLRYDQDALIRKFGLEHDAQYLYAKMLCKLYRVDRRTGDVERRDGEAWRDANTHAEVMTLFDLLCGSREDRYLAKRWKNMLAFGMQFHQNLMEEQHDPTAEAIDRDPMRLHRACARLGAEKIAGGDYGYAVELFDGLQIGILFWHGDEEFAPRIRYLWDENALMYLKYETMYYALSMLKARLSEDEPSPVL